MRLVILEHVLELSQRSNTGHHAPLVDPSIDLRIYGSPDQPLKIDDLQHAHLLWPSERPSTEQPPETLIILDASWSQAKRMVQRLPVLRGLPRVSLTPKPGRKSLREAPPGGMSTLEAIAMAVEKYEGPDAARKFHDAHDALVAKQLHERGYVGSYLNK